MKLLKFALIGLFFVGLIYWYTNQVKSKQDNDETKNIVKKNLKVDKDWRSLYVSTSANRLKNKKAPLIIFLHGLDGAWPSRKFTKPQYEVINKFAWDNDFIAAFPQGTLGACNNGTKEGEKYMFYYCWSTRNDRDIKFMKKIKEAVINQYGIDSEKVLLIGFSNGGYFVSNYMIKNHKNEFAGYGIHSAGGEIEKSDLINKIKNKFPISLNVGNKDKFQLDEMKKLKQDLLKLNWELDKNLNYNEYDANHEMSKSSLKKELNFFHLITNKSKSWSW